KWLATQPSVVVMDEPTSGVDVGARRVIYDLVRSYARSGAAVVFTSSDTQDLVEMADRVLLVARGKVAEVIDAESVTDQTVTEGLARVSARAGTTGKERTQ